MKKVLRIIQLILPLLLFRIGLVSAEGEFKALLSSIDSSLVFLLCIFIIAFSISFFAINKFFKENKTIVAIISLAISFLLTYGLSKTDLKISLGKLFLSIGLSETAELILWGLLILAGIVLIITRLKINSLLIFGIISILIGLFSTGILFFIVGGLLIIIRLFFKKTKEENKDY